MDCYSDCCSDGGKRMLQHTVGNVLSSETYVLLNPPTMFFMLKFMCRDFDNTLPKVSCNVEISTVSVLKIAFSMCLP